MIDTLSRRHFPKIGLAATAAVVVESRLGIAFGSVKIIYSVTEEQVKRHQEFGTIVPRPAAVRALQWRIDEQLDMERAAL